MARAVLQFRMSHRFQGCEFVPGDVIAEVELREPLTAERVAKGLRANIIEIVASAEDATTSREVASTAARVLADDESSEDAKSVAGSALAQAAPKRGRRRQ